jgi:hypothetical protein
MYTPRRRDLARRDWLLPIGKRSGYFLLFGGFRFGVILTAPLESFKRVFEGFNHDVRRYLLARPPVGRFVGDEHMG